MVNDLIVMTFDDEAAALRAKQALEQMRNPMYCSWTGIFLVGS